MNVRISKYLNSAHPAIRFPWEELEQYMHADAPDWPAKCAGHLIQGLQYLGASSEDKLLHVYASRNAEGSSLPVRHLSPEGVQKFRAGLYAGFLLEVERGGNDCHL